MMDQVEPDQRRLASEVAWDPKVGCGCIFGTIYPDTPRVSGGRTFIDFGTSYSAPEGPWDLKFKEWSKQIGLTLSDVENLQCVNDDFLDEDPTERWARVRRYCEARAEGCDDTQALDLMSDP